MCGYLLILSFDNGVLFFDNELLDIRVTGQDRWNG